MKNAIREYLDMTDSEKKVLLNTATLVFDTNVLLNIYRCSKSTRDVLLEIMNSFKDRLWIPYQVAKEFMSNRPEVIIETKNIYEKMIADGEKLVNDFAVLLRIKSNDKSCEELKDIITKWVEAKRKTNLEVSSCSDDKILERILTLFDGRVGEEYDSATLEKIKKDGKERYDKQIPPGYKDSKKNKGGNDNNAFGDLIYWKQILDYAKEKNTDVILVTSDQKEDWWSLKSGQTIGPRPELKKEFYDITGNGFHMYNMEQFIKIASKHPDAEVMEEIKSISVNHRLPEIGLMQIGFKPGTLSSIEEELYYLEEKNENQYSSLLGYEKLMASGKITPKQKIQYKQTKASFERDEKRIRELRMKLKRLTIIGLGNL